MTLRVRPSLRTSLHESEKTKGANLAAHSRPVGKQLMLLNETDLHYRVVAYLRRFNQNAIIVLGLGEMQNSSLKRSAAYRKGYKGGQPDLILGNLHISTTVASQLSSTKYS